MSSRHIFRRLLMRYVRAPESTLSSRGVMFTSAVHVTDDMARYDGGTMFDIAAHVSARALLPVAAGDSG